MTKDLLNELERQIVKDENSVNRLRWQQSEEVARRQDAGETYAQIAETWISLRTGAPYSGTHVHRYAQAWRKHGQDQLRPPFVEAYDKTTAERNERWKIRQGAKAKPSTLLGWATRSLVVQVEAGRVEALWEIEEALDALLEAVERARALVFEEAAA
jgi:hypothetical protein